jgi:hypothetical protein
VIFQLSNDIYIDAATHYVATQWARSVYGLNVELGRAIDAAPKGATVHNVPTPLTAIELAAEYVESERQKARREAYLDAAALVGKMTRIPKVTSIVLVDELQRRAGR